MLSNLVYIFCNYFVAYIPCWTVRKFFYRCLGMKLGRGTRINMRCVIMTPWKIKIGENTMINEYALIDGGGGGDGWQQLFDLDVQRDLYGQPLPRFAGVPILRQADQHRRLLLAGHALRDHAREPP